MPSEVICPHCSNDDESMIEKIVKGKWIWYLCAVCGKTFVVK